MSGSETKKSPFKEPLPPKKKRKYDSLAEELEKVRKQGERSSQPEELLN